MVNRLSGLVSNKSRKPVILNGRLVTTEGRVLTARRDGYKVVLSAIGAGREETILDDGDELLAGLADEFNKKYTAIATGDTEELQQFRANVDPFTGAIVLKNGLYDRLLDKDNELHIHDGVLTLLPEVEKEVRQFGREFMLDYFEIYNMLLSRRLTASHMPMRIKGHLVAGLFQPFVVGTKQIDCPYSMAEFDWVHSLFSSSSLMEKRLEGAQETPRGLELTVISMYDFCNTLGIPLRKELPRKYFHFMLCFTFVSLFDPYGPDEMSKRFHRIYNMIDEGRGDTKGVKAFTADCIKAFNHARTGISVVRR